MEDNGGKHWVFDSGIKRIYSDESQRAELCENSYMKLNHWGLESTTMVWEKKPSD